MENRSGQGEKAEVPAEIVRWSWGAFFLNGIWGLGNRTYFALLAFIPILNIMMMIVLGFQGRKLAWKNKDWESIEHFEAVQRKWDIAGFVALAVYLFYVIKGFISIL